MTPPRSRLFLTDMYARPTDVRGCASPSDFSRPGVHGAVRFYLYRRAAAHLGYRGCPRLPLPFEMEELIRSLYMGDGPQSWTFAFNRINKHSDPLHLQRIAAHRGASALRPQRVQASPAGATCAAPSSIGSCRGPRCSPTPAAMRLKRAIPGIPLERRRRPRLRLAPPRWRRQQELHLQKMELRRRTRCSAERSWHG